MNIGKEFQCISLSPSEKRGENCPHCIQALINEVLFITPADFECTVSVFTLIKASGIKLIL
jgi:hypothetical protein